MIIDFIRGTEQKGAIIVNGEKSYIACTGAESRTYKTERGARKFMETKGYREVTEVKTDTVGNIVEVVEMGEVEIVEVNDGLVGLTEEIVKTEGVSEEINNYLAKDIDKYDFIDRMNEKVKDKNIIVIDSRYSVKSDVVADGSIKTGSTVRAVDPRLFKGEATVIGTAKHFHTKRVIAVLSNGVECFADGGNLIVVSSKDTPETVTVAELQKGDIINMTDKKQAIVVDVYPTAHGFYNIHVEYFDTKYKTGSYTKLCMVRDRLNEKSSKKYKVFGNDYKYSVKTIKDQCPKCGGTGILTHYMHHDNGICYKCKGTGKKQGN